MMGIQAMHNTSFLLDQCSWEDWTAVEDFCQRDFKAYNSPFRIRDATIDFP